MTNLSITSAWNETAAFVKRHAQLLFPLAFLLISLPGAILQSMMPAAERGTPPEGGAWLLLAPIAMVLSIVGSLALSYLALTPGVSGADALRRAGRRFLSMLGAVLLLLLAFLLLMIPFVLVGAVTLVGSGASPEAAGPIGAALALFLLILGLAVGVRLILMTPVAAAEDLGSLSIVKRSWALTRGRFWKLFGLLALAILVILVVTGAVVAVLGSAIILIAGPNEPGSLTATLILLLTAVVNSLFAVYFTTMIARVYAQLGGRPAASTNGI